MNIFLVVKQSMKLTALNKIVEKFLQDCQVDPEVYQRWLGDDLQKRVKTAVNKCLTCTKKDLNAPKRPQTAYLLFCNAHRDEVKQQLSVNGNSDTKNVTKELARQWNLLRARSGLPVEDGKLDQDEDLSFSPESQALYEEYQQKAESEKEKYKVELSSYKPSQKTSRSGKRKRDQGEPKKAQTSYLLFCNALRPRITQELQAANPSSKKDRSVATNVTKQLGVEWNLLKQRAEAGERDAVEQLEHYTAMAAQDVQRYEAEKEQYEAGHESQSTQVPVKTPRSTVAKQSKVVLPQPATVKPVATKPAATRLPSKSAVPESKAVKPLKPTAAAKH